jgi:hypothetical protein
MGCNSSWFASVDEDLQLIAVSPPVPAEGDIGYQDLWITRVVDIDDLESQRLEVAEAHRAGPFWDLRFSRRAGDERLSSSDASCRRP